MALPYSGDEAYYIGQVVDGVDGGFDRDDLYGNNEQDNRPGAWVFGIAAACNFRLIPSRLFTGPSARPV